MTIWCKRTEIGDQVEVHVTYGPVAFKVTEPSRDIRHFWGQLGALLEETENKAAAEE